MKPRKQRRAGATATVGVSLDARTRQTLKALASETHRGNVSALITDLAAVAVRQAAFERAWRWYGGPETSEEVVAKLDAEMEGGWTLARKHAGRKTRRRSAA